MEGLKRTVLWSKGIVNVIILKEDLLISTSFFASNNLESIVTQLMVAQL